MPGPMLFDEVERLSKLVPLTKVYDVAFVRFSAPDLDEFQAFLEDFGLKIVQRTEDTIYSRGVGKSPFHHVVHKGEPYFIGFGFEVFSSRSFYFVNPRNILVFT